MKYYFDLEGNSDCLNPDGVVAENNERWSAVLREWGITNPNYRIDPESERLKREHPEREWDYKQQDAD